MGFWGWFAIWSVLGLAAIITFALMGYGLFVKGEAAFHQLERLSEKVQPLESAINQRQEIERPAPSMLAPSTAITKRKALLKLREQKAHDRQRRLIARLKDIQIDESRFS